MRNIEISAEWFFDKMIHTTSACGNIASLGATYENSKWVELALTQIGVDFETSDCDENDDVWIDFAISDIDGKLPKLYDSLFDMGIANHRNQMKNEEDSRNIIKMSIDEYNSVSDITTIKGVHSIIDLVDKNICIYLDRVLKINDDRTFMGRKEYFHYMVDEKVLEIIKNK